MLLIDILFKNMYDPIIKAAAVCGILSTVLSPKGVYNSWKLTPGQGGINRIEHLDKLLTARKLIDKKMLSKLFFFFFLTTTLFFP